MLLNINAIGVQLHIYSYFPLKSKCTDNFPVFILLYFFFFLMTANSGDIFNSGKKIIIRFSMKDLG